MSFSNSHYHSISKFTLKQEQEYFNPPKRDWTELDRRHRHQGSFIITFAASCLILDAPEYTGRGRPVKYSDELVLNLLVLSYALRVSLRKVIGVVEGIVALTGQSIQLPHYSLLSKRDLEFDSASLRQFVKAHTKQGIVIAVDSTGLRSDNRGLHCETKHADTKIRRRFFKMHTAVDVETQEIVSHELTDEHIADITIFKKFNHTGIFDKSTTLGDGAYDSHELYDMAQLRQGTHIAPPSVDAVINKKRGYSYPRNKAVRAMRNHSLHEWKEQVGYHKRSLVETVNHVFKAMFGESVRSQTYANVKKEVTIKIGLYNKFIAC